MGKGNKTTKGIKIKASKETVRVPKSSNSEKAIWMFDRLDRGGEFAFNTKREDFDHPEFLDKMIAYSNMTWNEILKQTHDDNRSKHHSLAYDALSKKAKDRIDVLQLGEDTDRIFSFALSNKLRVVGLRDDEKFHVIWYDADHQFCPATKKHT